MINNEKEASRLRPKRRIWGGKESVKKYIIQNIILVFGKDYIVV